MPTAGTVQGEEVVLVIGPVLFVPSALVPGSVPYVVFDPPKPCGGIVYPVGNDVDKFVVPVLESVTLPVRLLYGPSIGYSIELRPEYAALLVVVKLPDVIDT